MEVAYDVKDSSEKVMGPNFNFKTWCNSWLLTSGANFLHPIIEYD
jgi:hypothetical protein